MLKYMRKAVLAAVSLGISIAVPSQAHAGPVLDWLLGRPVLVYPAQPVAGYPAQHVVGYAPNPVTTNYWGVASAAPVSQSAYFAPQQSCAATPVYAAQHPVFAQPLFSGYAPSYRTSYYRVPVTYYRPAISYQTSGMPVATGVPCNSYAWQAQRVPVLLNRPWLPFNQPVYSAAPAYAPNHQFAPVYGTPMVGNVPATYAPNHDQSQCSGLVAPSGASPSVGAAVPADQAPTLLQQNYPVIPTGEFAPQPASPVAPDASLLNAKPAGATNTQVQSQSPYRVSPIPAPDVRQTDKPVDKAQAPALLNARERSASTAQRVGVEPASLVTPKAAATSKSSALWHDSGWRTAY